MKDSYTQVEASIVKRACLNYLEHNKKVAEKKTEEMIAQEMAEGKGWLWWKRPMTREEATKSLNDARWNYCWMYYSHDSQIYDKERVAGLLALANLGDPISLCAEDAILVDNYKELK